MPVVIILLKWSINKRLSIDCATHTTVNRANPQSNLNEGTALTNQILKISEMMLKIL